MCCCFLPITFRCANFSPHTHHITEPGFGKKWPFFLTKFLKREIQNVLHFSIEIHCWKRPWTHPSLFANVATDAEPLLSLSAFLFSSWCSAACIQHAKVFFFLYWQDIRNFRGRPKSCGHLEEKIISIRLAADNVIRCWKGWLILLFRMEWKL